jgi:hypothetical protein
MIDKPVPILTTRRVVVVAVGTEPALAVNWPVREAGQTTEEYQLMSMQIIISM